ncbi:MAG: S9 family peptidase [Verrucomicrobia bacterium]|nr:S9 family peptidase [Verrucomicrobiota bacterium]
MIPPLAFSTPKNLPLLKSDAAVPPAAERRPKTVGLHGDRIEDPYFWLREKDSPAVLKYLKAENAYAAAVMGPFKPFEDALYRELLGRIKQTDVSVPYRQRGYWLYQRTEEGKQYAVLCRKKGSLDAPEEVVLDVNRLAEGQKFMALGTFEYSDDNALLAYSTDTTGHRDYDFHLKNLVTGEEIETPIGKVAALAWAADNRTIFYVTENEAKRAYRLWRYTLGEREPKLLYEEKDELFDLTVDRSRDGKFLFAGSVSKRTSEYRFLRANEPAGEFELIAPRRDEIEYYPEHRDGLFYLRTNAGAKEFRVVTTEVATPGAEHWQEFIPMRPGIKIEDFEPYAKYAVIVEREAGLPQFRILEFGREGSRRIPFPEPAYEAAPDQNAEFTAETFRFDYESPITPFSVFEYAFATGEQTLLKRTEVLGGYDPTRYAVERVPVTAADGVQVPLDIVHRKDTALDGSSPCWLYGYGSYGISLDTSFSSSRLSLLDRGVIFSLAHVRGGGELGEAWHEGGRMMTKKNTFTDFIACADYLVARHYTTHEKMVIEGASAGGLLIGTVLNLRPDVCKAAILGVPFVDVLNTMSDPSLPLTTSEYIEWGNPNNREEYDYIKSYSPYDNLRADHYPNILLLASLNDSQVPYWEPAKYAARLRALKTDHNVLLLRSNLEAGHGGASGRYDRLREIAFEYTFGLAALGLANGVGEGAGR